MQQGSNSPSSPFSSPSPSVTKSKTIISSPKLSQPPLSSPSPTHRVLLSSGTTTVVSRPPPVTAPTVPMGTRRIVKAQRPSAQTAAISASGSAVAPAGAGVSIPTKKPLGMELGVESLAGVELSRLVLLHQSSLAVEKTSKNGIQKSVHVVVKNQPFIVQISSQSNGNMPAIDFNTVSVEATLLYDTPEMKEVAFIKVKPFEYNAQASSEGLKCTLEFSLKVLSSQHEDTNFVLRLQVVDSMTRLPLPGLSLITHPIKVISKPEVILPKAERKAQKRTRDDSFLEVLARIEQQQKEQQQLLSQIMQNTTNIDSLLGFASSFPLPLPEGENFISPSCLPSNTSQGETKPVLPSVEEGTKLAADRFAPAPEVTNPELEFENAFHKLIMAYKNLDENERPTKLRKVVEKTPQEDTSTIAQMMDILSRQGICKVHGVGCTSCQQKTQLDQLDLFYDEFLSLDSFSQPPF